MLIKTIVQKAALLLMMCLGLPLLASAADLRGVVTDSDKNPLLAVALQVNDGESGTVTDFNGNYFLPGIEKGDKIVAFYIGMETQTIVYDGSTTNLTIVMQSDAKQIEEVVVVGFGEQKKESVVGSITQATGEDILRAGNVQSIGEALTGILPGVSTMQASGQPGAGSNNVSILIRGQSSWGDNKPLYMVDGVEREFADIDPNEIASISVLKDASATAVYGVKAANGVILVTTKTGGESKARVSFSGTYTWKSPTSDTDYISDFPTTLSYYNRAAMNEDNYGLVKTDKYIGSWTDPTLNREMWTYTRWANEMFKVGHSQAYNVSVSGGTKTVKYFTSIGYNQDGDILDVSPQRYYDPTTKQDRYNWRSNLDFQVTKTTKFSVKLAGDVISFNGNGSTSGTGVGNTTLAQIFNSVMTGTAPKLGNGGYGDEAGSTSAQTNVLAKLEGFGSFHRRSNRLFTDFALEQQIAKGLKFTAKFSYDQYRAYQYSVTNEHIAYYWPQEDGSYEITDETLELDLPNNNAESINGYNKSMNYEAALRYNKTFNDVHEVSAIALVTRREYQNKVAWKEKSESWVGRATYAYDKKYLVEFNGAYNGSECYAPGYRFGFFPSAAVGWVLTQENFFKEKLPAIEFMKIRYSYGLVGSDKSAPDYAYISVFSQGWQNIFLGQNGTATTGYYREGTPANEEASWETAIKQNLGFEFTFMDGRLGTTFDLFNEARDGIYMNYNTIPVWYGGKVPGANMGETKNHGFDLELTWDDKVGDVRYWAKGSLSMSENRMVYRNDTPGTPEYQRNAGKPIGWQAGYLDNGFYQNWQDVYLYTPSSFTSDLQPGDLIFSDFNCDGLIETDDRVAIGTSKYATKTYAFSGGLSWKGFSVSAMFNGMFDLSKTLDTEDLFCYRSTFSSALGFVMNNNDKMDAWTATNTDAVHPVLHTKNVTHNIQTSTYTMGDSDFLRLRNLEVKYTFGEKFKKKTNFVSNLEVFVSGQNLCTWSKLPDIYDPEASSLEVYPITKRYNVGLRCTF